MSDDYDNNNFPLVAITSHKKILTWMVSFGPTIAEKIINARSKTSKDAITEMKGWVSIWHTCMLNAIYTVISYCHKQGSYFQSRAWCFLLCCYLSSRINWFVQKSYLCPLHKGFMFNKRRSVPSFDKLWDLVHKLLSTLSKLSAKKFLVATVG